MDWGAFAIQWLHVLLGMFWLGGTLYLNFIVIPAAMTLPMGSARDAGRAIAARGKRIIPRVAEAVIVLGLLRGTVFGQLKSLDAVLNTSYGHLWLIGLVAAVATYLWGTFMLARPAERLYGDDALWVPTAEGRPSAAMLVASGRVRRNGMLELVGFAVILTSMLLMRFGF